MVPERGHPLFDLCEQSPCRKWKWHVLVATIVDKRVFRAVQGCVNCFFGKGMHREKELPKGRTTCTPNGGDIPPPRKLQVRDIPGVAWNWLVAMLHVSRLSQQRCARYICRPTPHKVRKIGLRKHWKHRLGDEWHVIQYRRAISSCHTPFVLLCVRV